MSKGGLIVGLDIGTTKICAVVGENTSTGIDIVGIGSSSSIGLRDGVVVNIEQTVQSIKKALEEASLMAGCEIHNVYAGIAGSHIKGFNSHGVVAVTGGEVGSKDIGRALDAARAVAIPLDREVVHVLPQEFVVDDQRGISDPLGMAGVRLEVKVHIVTGAVTSAQNIIKSCDRSGLLVSDIVLEALASAKAVLTDEERELGVALVDIGGGTADIAVFVQNAIRYTGVIPMAGQYITNDIAFGLRTPMSAAEMIKTQSGCAMKSLIDEDDFIEVPSVGGRESRRVVRKVLAQICEARMEEILRHIDKELSRSEYKDRLGAGVVLTGGTALLPGVVDLAGQIFDLPTRIGYPRNLGGLKDVVNNPRYATAVGLLQYASEKEEKGSIKKSMREDSVVKKVTEKMRRWFSDIW
ncbi:MAG: cell division protein FtsA [Desulfovibrionaceae bacterium]